MKFRIVIFLSSVQPDGEERSLKTTCVTGKAEEKASTSEVRRIEGIVFLYLVYTHVARFLTIEFHEFVPNVMVHKSCMKPLVIHGWKLLYSYYFGVTSLTHLKLIVKIGHLYSFKMFDWAN